MEKKLWCKDGSLESNAGEQYTFEQINNLLELYLPVFYKGLIKLNENDIFSELTQYLHNIYSEKNKKVNDLLEPINGIPEIPIEILCKYYARLYTIESDFYKDINKLLRERNIILKEEEILFSVDNRNYYSITYIKSFYEGMKLGCFKLDFSI